MDAQGMGRRPRHDGDEVDAFSRESRRQRRHAGARAGVKDRVSRRDRRQTKLALRTGRF